MSPSKRDRDVAKRRARALVAGAVDGLLASGWPFEHEDHARDPSFVDPDTDELTPLGTALLEEIRRVAGRLREGRAA